jgi:hypothetical protein
LKRIVPVLLLLVLLAGCAGSGNTMDRVAALRSGILAKGAEFDAAITADYGDKTYTFGMHCRLEKQGKLSFAVTAPESISGITGTVSASGGELTFDGNALAFPLLAEGQFSPVSGPWILMKTLRSGYLTSCGVESGCIRVAIDDSYEEDALHLDIWLDEKDLPKRGEILWQGRRILSLDIENFVFL